MATLKPAGKCAYIFKAGNLKGRQCPRLAIDGGEGLCKKHLALLRKPIDESDVLPSAKRTKAVREVRKREKTTKEKRDLARNSVAEELVRQQGVGTGELLISGAIDVDDLSWDELIGGFVYVRDPITKEIIDRREPKLIPRAFYTRVTRTLIAQSDQLFRDQFMPAMQALTDLITRSGTRRGSDLPPRRT